MPFPDLVHPHIDAYESAVVTPADFSQFWASTLAEARAIGGAMSMVPADTTLKLVEAFDVTFPGFGGHPIKGWLVLPRERSGRLPLVVQYVGYGGGRGGMFLARGGASVITRDSIPVNHDFYGWISDLTLRLPGGGRLSFIGLLMVAVFIIGALVAHRTKFGSYVYALGGNETSASLMGVPVARTTVGVYMLSSMLAALAGIVFSLYTSAGYPLAAVGVELDAISAVVIGGTLLTGGYGFVLGTFIGVMLLGLVQTYIIFDGSLSSWWTKIVIGALLFLFIVLQRLIFAASTPGEKSK